MTFKKTLLSIIAGTALALSPQSKAVTNDCYVYQYNNTFDEALANSNEGDVINIRRGDYSIAVMDATINKNVTITSTEGLTVRGIFNVTENANVTFDNVGSSYFGIRAKDNSSVNVQNCYFAWTGDTQLPYVDFNSTGNLKVQNNYFSTMENAGNAINISNYNQADITKNIFYWFSSAVNVTPNIPTQLQAGKLSLAPQQRTTADSGRVLNILNNTIDQNYQTALVINDDSAQVNILNNSISNVGKALDAPTGANNIVYESNNIWQETGGLNLARTPLKTANLESLTLVGTDGNYSFEPNYLDPFGSYQLATNSDLWFRGRYVEGQTPYFANAQQTYIGANGNGMPETIPEPKAWQLVVAGLALGGALNYLRKRNSHEAKIHRRVNKLLTGINREEHINYLHSKMGNNE